MTAINSAELQRLKAVVQAVDTRVFEHLVAGLIGELIGTSLAVAKPGFQHGADAGTTGRQQRYLRIECKRYQDNTGLNDRELLGEMDQAFAQDPALEAWVLAATREVPEQLEKALSRKGDGQGVPVLIIDWKSHETPTLAALLASSPTIVDDLLGHEAAAIAAALQPLAASQIERLRRDLASWQIGTANLRRRAWERLEAIWDDPRQSQSHFGQVVSGGAKKLIHRTNLLQSIDDWWKSPPGIGAPLCAVGFFGVGKTWVVADWLIRNKDSLPTTLLVPASAVSSGFSSVYALKTFLAQRLQELMQVRDVEHWRNRLDRILLRPEEEGCALLIVFDGLNQQPGVDWAGLLSMLQSDEFRGRIRVIATTRSHHFETRLQKLRRLLDRAVEVEVNVYDALPAGELDQMLGLNALTRSDLHPDLIQLAQNPRLFDLVIRFRGRLVDGGGVTLHRLLWEYGRDTAGQIMNRVFSEREWEEWLQTTARSLRGGIRTYTTQELSTLAARPDLNTTEVYQRLSEIIDTPFVQARADQTLELSPDLVAHALGAMAVSLLTSAPTKDRGAMESTLAQWLDPISGLDQRAQILRAAVAIALESGAPRLLHGVLTAAWLQTQNLAEVHLRDIHALAPEISEALLDTIEMSHRHTHAASQEIAVAALRSVDRNNPTVRQVVLKRAEHWLRVISRDVEPRSTPNAEAERSRRDRLIGRIGVDVAGERQLLGESMELVDRDDTMLAEHLPGLLEGYPLLGALPALRIAAISAAVSLNHLGWNQLRWTCLLNPIDPHEVAEAARQAATEMMSRVPEPSVHPHLNARVAELLLRIPGTRQDDESAAAIEVGFMGRPDYEADYLSNPSTSFYALERRHASAALTDTSLNLRYRAQRCETLWADPTFEPPAAFCEEVAAFADNLSVERLFTGRYLTADDHEFDQFQAVLARCAPKQLADLRRRLARDPATQASRAARSWQINQALLIYGADEAAGARAARTLGRELRDGDETVAASELLRPELARLDALTQAITVIEAALPHIPTALIDALPALTTEQVDELIRRFQHGTPEQQRDLAVLLAADPPLLSDFAWEWVSTLTTSEDPIDVRIGHIVLVRTDAKRLGRDLDSQGWRFTAELDTFSAHYASGALFEATVGVPFEQVAVRLAPWRLLEAVRHRGGDAAETRLAVEILDSVLTGGPAQPLDMAGQLGVRRKAGSTDPSWYSVEPLPHDNPHSLEAMRDILDDDARLAARDRVSEVVRQQIEKVRREGASLFLEFVTPEDGLALCRHAPEVMERWLDGHDSLSPQFIRRVTQAEGLFLALCEALLIIAPERGVRLWKSLRLAIRTRITGPADLPELLHVIFRAPTSPPVLEARRELFDLTTTNSDADLYEVALVAILNHQTDWLESQMASDTTSDLPWRQQRAAVLSGFTINNELSIAEAWPEGPSKSWAEEVGRQSARARYFEACARHWWTEYWRLENLDEAYAAWVLFGHFADRRALSWMGPIAEQSPNSASLKETKRRHWQANRLSLKHGAEESKLQLGRKFLRRRIEAKVWPWRERS
ncbi:hypothetical protein FCE95_07625 [Luteimonas gilva]|uniref:NACHT domain-containing protein n=1 Tax=Luteimonas gilva TaxID=2572684 RepID=A0A4U5JW14_9GAMM|nr:hypothetical protein [Luteimonas gilva]TKR34124.1 hypothetical protein FCE95_07625 [Luteimonas gilva]